jgi:hypothetical protein
VQLAITTSPFSWTRSLLNALPVDTANLLESTGVRHILETMLDSHLGLVEADESGTKKYDSLSINQVEKSVARIAADHPSIPYELKSDQEFSHSFNKYIPGRPLPEVMALRNLVKNMQKKGMCLGRVISSETPHRPAIVLFDSDKPETLAIASAIHSLYYWRYVSYRNRGIKTRPVLYFADSSNTDMPQFLIESSAGHTCVASGTT